jgi:hypothetical protein
MIGNSLSSGTCPILLKKLTGQLKKKALNYASIDGRLYRRGKDGLLLRCVSEQEAEKMMFQVVCGSHQAGHKMRWLIRRHGHYWPTILFYCIKYAKGCQACQKHGPVQHVPASELHPILNTSRLKL